MPSNLQYVGYGIGGLTLVLSLPLLTLAAPFLIVPLMIGYFTWYMFGPVKPVKSPLRSVECGEKRPNETRPRRWATQPTIQRSWGIDDVTTMPQLVEKCAEKFPSRRAVGARKTIKIEKKIIKQEKDGKTIEKEINIPWQTDYEWRTWTQMYDEISRFGRGLVHHGVQAGERVSIFASTRPEWQIAAHACFRHGLPIVTLYPSLGVDAVSFGLNQAGVKFVITEASKLNTIIEAASLVKSLEYVIFFDEIDAVKLAELEKKTRLTLISYAQLLIKGVEPIKEPLPVVKPSDTAVIMYTSGSTGTPKGVCITHTNLLATAWAVMHVPPEPLSEKDVYIGFLPLAHVLELAAETLVLGLGGQIGYSSPATLQDNGVKNEHGEPCGDLRLLRPTIMAGVPLILDRLRNAVVDQVNKSPIPMKIVFKIAYYLKEREWLRGHKTPLLDKLVFNKISAKLGGRVKYLLSGGAPLSEDTQRFINIVFCTSVLQGYGLTETSAANLITHPDDRTTGHVGAPLPSCEVVLRDVPEMNYRHTNTDSHGHPIPQGEICIRGACVTDGYFKLPDQTSQFFEAGKKGATDGSEFPLFCTGDIGQWNPDGTLSIIDRKKDLVKLAHGEYIALGNLESVYLHAPIVEQICLYGDAQHQRPIALVVPKKDQLKNRDLKSQQAKKQVMDQLNKFAIEHKLQKWEMIGGVYLTDDEWSPASGLLTEAMKMKRHEIKKKYKKQIEETYKDVKG